jgi:2-polyprenyl-3-methyl-5-hydroxy-6-metoxy-1,4-benzoquinol methylase
LKNDTEYVDCPLCDSNHLEPRFISKDYLFSQREFSIVRCRSCGLYFTNPRIKASQISNYYFSSYPAYKESMRSAGSFSKIKTSLGSLLGNPHHHILNLLKSVRAKTVLEIGPGAGNLLSFLKEHGFEVVGVEIDAKCVERIREKGIACYLGDLNEVMGAIDPKKFDAVILHHVFEHLYRPLETLKTIHNLLKENGIVYLSIPNSGSIEAKLFGKYWRGLDLPRHVIHYNPNTIRSILAETGFRIIKLENDIFPSSFIESIGFRFFRNGKMPNRLYYLLYYPWKLTSPIHTKIIDSGVMRVVASKANEHMK